MDISGLLALFSFVNRKPVFTEVNEVFCSCLIKLYNPNKNHPIILDEIVDHSTHKELKAIRPNEIGSYRYKNVEVGDRYRLGDTIEPRSSYALVFNSIDFKDCNPCQDDPSRFTIDRVDFNFFKPVQSFNLIVKSVAKKKKS